jgi:hypothetical protein
LPEKTKRLRERLGFHQLHKDKTGQLKSSSNGHSTLKNMLPHPLLALFVIATFDHNLSRRTGIMTIHIRILLFLKSLSADRNTERQIETQK